MRSLPMERDSRLLIVDDNAPTRYAMRRVLERHGYQVLGNPALAAKARNWWPTPRRMR